MNLSPRQIEILNYIRKPRSCGEIVREFGYTDYNEMIDDLFYFNTRLYYANDDVLSDDALIQATPLAISVVDLYLKDNDYKNKMFIAAIITIILSAGSLIATVIFGLK